MDSSGGRAVRRNQTAARQFAPDGPERCSGLPIVRYSPETLGRELGPGLILVEAVRHVHTTPWGATQAFQYSRFHRTD